MTIELAVLLAASLSAARAEPAGPASRLLAEALLAPKVPCAGALSVSSGGGKARKLCVWYAPGGRLRRDLLDGRGNVVRTAVSDGAVSWFYDRARRAAWKGTAEGPAATPVLARDEDIRLLLRNYSAVLEEAGGRVAGRPCRVLTLRSASGGTARRLWIDEEYGLPLQVRAYGEDGRLSSTVRFLRVDFPPRLNEDIFRFSPPEGATLIPSRKRPSYLAEGSPSASAMRPLLPAWTPPGFVLEGSEVVEYRGRKVLHTRYSDGLEGLSLFQLPESLRLDPAGLAESERGLRRLERRRGGRGFVLIGRLPEDALARMADSLP